MIGSSLAHYRILQKLGAGGMGDVYLAEDTKLKRRLALKVLPAPLASDAEYLKRFEREAEAIAALNHPNIVTIYSVEEIGGVRCLTMELVEGGTLADRISAGPLAVREILDLAIPLADCLAAAHERGVIHRDLKPNNIMVSGEGRVKVLDFGLAKRVEDETIRPDSRPSELLTEAPLTAKGTVLGTIEYMAPEQLQGKSSDPRSDIFSLGVTLYEMASGVRPFRGSSMAELISSVLRDDQEPILSLRPDLPPELARLIDRSLEKSPDRRLQSAKDLRNELQAIRDTLILSKSRPIPVTRVSAPRSRVSWLAYAALAAVAATAVWGGFVLARRTARPPAVAASAGPALAVLPMANLTGEPEYFVDGMTDALISALGNIGSLRVISRQSIMRYKGSTKTLPEIARELGVDIIVEGSVVKAGPRVRITAQLVRADPEKQLWTHSYERDFRDLLGLQSDVAVAIAREVQVKLTPQEKALLASARSVDPAVQDAYLQGRYFQRSSEGLPKAIESFGRAIALDPTHAPSHAGLADSYALLGYTAVVSEELFSKAREEAQKALAIDSTLAEAHATLGFVRLFHDWDWAGAEKQFRLAIANNASSAYAHQLYWGYLEAMGRRKEALGEIQLARQLDPLSLVNGLDLAVHYFFAGDRDAAIAQCRKILDMNPKFAPAELWLWIAYDRKGQREEAYRHLLQTLRLYRHDSAAAAVEETYAKSGYPAAVQKAAEELAEISRTRYVDSNQIAWLWSASGNREGALRWLEQAFDRRAAVLVWLNVPGEFEPLRGDPRFQALLARLRFPA
jgi:serine/threonine-protein kinase